MSYILDALRKSEAARRSREAPDLLAQTAAPLPLPAGRSLRYAGRPAWVVAALGFSALALALWLRYGERAADTAASASDPAAVASHGPTLTDDDESPPRADEYGAGTAPDTTDSRVDSSAEARPSLDPGRPPGEIPGMAPNPMPMRPPAPPPAPAATPRPDPLAAAPAVAAPPATDRGPRDTAVPASPPARPVVAPDTPPLPADGRPVALADLAPEQRRQLPPLRMSMHLWNEAPERRLLVLDGQRLRQGDVLGDVVVERIDRNGAVLAWRGGRILLPAE